MPFGATPPFPVSVRAAPTGTPDRLSSSLALCEARSEKNLLIHVRVTHLSMTSHSRVIVKPWCFVVSGGSLTITSSLPMTCHPCRSNLLSCSNSAPTAPPVSSSRLEAIRDARKTAALLQAAGVCRRHRGAQAVAVADRLRRRPATAEWVRGHPAARRTYTRYRCSQNAFMKISIHTMTPRTLSLSSPDPHQQPAPQ